MITEHSLLIASKRQRGRPRVDEPRSAVSTRIFSGHHDALVRMAAARDVSVSALVKEILTKAVTQRR